ncbi:MAG: hypothetical protein K0Q79_585 [Flavipsychrobacter sp.]|jgi:hypothetical protein|nr:hypothetical protein [Flavipsychrobacter sp.]
MNNDKKQQAKELYFLACGYSAKRGEKNYQKTGYNIPKQGINIPFGGIIIPFYTRLYLEIKTHNSAHSAFHPHR